MHIGLVGLGKMGGNMRSRLRKNGIEVTGFARTREVSDVDTIEEMVSKISSPRIVCLLYTSDAADE